MIGSVYNWDTAKYHYFEVADTKPGYVGGGWVNPPTLQARGGTQYGVALEDILPVLPTGSRPVGTGREAQGRIFTLPRGALGRVYSLKSSAGEEVVVNEPPTPLLAQLFQTILFGAVTAATYAFTERLINGRRK